METTVKAVSSAVPTYRKNASQGNVQSGGQKMIKAFGYIRVSTDMQANFGVSLDAQTATIKNYALALGYKLVNIFVDTESAKDTIGRKEYQKMMQRVDDGECSLIISSCLDRFTRSLRDFMDFTEQYIRTDKCHIVLVQESINTISPMSRQILPLLVALAQLERERTSERVKQVIKHIRESGGHYGKVPFGYRTVKDGKLKRLERDPALWVWAERMKQWKQAGDNFDTIAQRLNESGVKPSYSDKWSKTSVYDYMVNEGLHIPRSVTTDRVYDKAEATRIAIELRDSGKTQPYIAQRLNELGYRPRKASGYEWHSVQTLLRAEPTYNLADKLECALCYRAKGLSLAAVGEKLLTHGHRPLRGKVWRATSVSNLLNTAPRLKVA